MLRTGTRQQLEAELAELAEGWGHLEDRPRQLEVLAALTELRNGSAAVRAGHCEYRVSELQLV